MITKTCILIAGANCSGKTSVARGLLDHFGGIGNVTPDSTFSADGRAVFAGRYANVKHGGVDYLNSTKPLQGIVRNGLLTADFAVCEGSYLDTFGMNLLNAIFEAKRQAYVALWCSRAKLYERNRARLNVDSLAKLYERRGGGNYAGNLPQTGQGVQGCEEIRLNRCSRPRL